VRVLRAHADVTSAQAESLGGWGVFKRLRPEPPGEADLLVDPGINAEEVGR
jgi:hypothetical protein